MNRRPFRASRCRLALVLVMLAIGATDLSIAATRYRASILPALPGQPSAFPNAINSDGTIVGAAGAHRFDPRVVPVIASGGLLMPLPTLAESSQNFPLSVNDSGLIVGSANVIAFAWSNSTPQYLLGPPGFAYDVNNADQICGSLINDLLAYEFPVVWDGPAEDNVPLANLGFPQGAAFAINDAAQVAGALLTSAGYVGVRWQSAAHDPLAIGGLDGASLSEFVDINAAGDMVGRSSFPDDSTQAMLYISATQQLIALGTLGGNYSYAHAVNAARQVVGDANVNELAHAFLWQNGVMHDLNDLVASSDATYDYVASAVDVNNAGQIAAEVVLVDSPHRIALLTPIRRSDVNCDGRVDFFDLDPFLLALFDPPGYEAAYPRCDAMLADVNDDQAVDLFDIDPFVACLLGGVCP